MELIRILAAHAQRYPLMRPADAVKLIYQNEFGGGHLITNPSSSLASLRTEYAATPPDSTAPLAEDIGNGWVRVSLAALDSACYPLEVLHDDFVRSAQRSTGTRESFQEKLEYLKSLTKLGFFNFSAAELDDYLSGYSCSPVSHSPQFRDAYRPAYRVVSRACLSCSISSTAPERRSLQAVAQLLAQEISCRHSPLIVAIDGRCASGKTTLASLLQSICGCSVLHLDDFFLRPEQRTPERLAKPGGNVDHERFLSQVLLPLRAGKPAVYRPFDCHTGTLTPPVCLKPSAVTVVEGSYACHPSLLDYYDLRIFLTTAPGEQTRRLLAREGPESFRLFRTRWVPLEERYISAYRPEQRCDFCFDTGDR